MMLQIKCRHLKAIPTETCCFCNSSAPDSLVDICVEYIVKNLHIICDHEPFSGRLRLKRHVTLPVEICERLLNSCVSKGGDKYLKFLNIFRHTHATGLKRVKLKNDVLQDADLFVLLKHKLLELEITHCPSITANCLYHIIRHASNLTTLVISDIKSASAGENLFSPDSLDEHVITTPQLRKLCLRNVTAIPVHFFAKFFKRLHNLTYLDLSNCTHLDDLHFIQHLNCLTSLILYDMNDIEGMIPTICKLRNLKHLDISQSNDERGKYKEPNQVLATIVESLPRLVSLDISGTNLAGRGVVQTMGSERVDLCDIPGLNSRVNNPLQFLGLYDTQHDACLRHDIPAKLVSL